MVEIRAFSGVVYNWDKIGDVSQVLAPPYDVISPAEQEALYKRHPHNVVRLILGRIRPEDTDADNRYTRSAAELRAWKAEGVLRPYPTPALYLYSQEYQTGGVWLHRAGFVCRLKLEDYGQGRVFPHERTLSGPKTDRLNLTRACKTNFSQIFGLYADPSLTLDAIFEGIMKRVAPAVQAQQDGVVHRMWPITDTEIIAKVTAFMADKDMVIADGHHRYETALNYRNERREQEKGAPGEYDYVLMFLSNTHGQGFTVLPTHRFVLQCQMTPVEAAHALAVDFDVTERKVTREGVGAFMAELKSAGEKATSFGMYCGGGSMRLLRLKKTASQPNPPGSDTIPALRRLDVTILQELILSKALGITREKVEAGGHIYYTISGAEAMDKVDSRAARMAFLMNPTGIGQVMDIARSGGVMPQKSTYFYPKLISGLVFNPLY